MNEKLRILLRNISAFRFECLELHSTTEHYLNLSYLFIHVATETQTCQQWLLTLHIWFGCGRADKPNVTASTEEKWRAKYHQHILAKHLLGGNKNHFAPEG